MFKIVIFLSCKYKYYIFTIFCVISLKKRQTKYIATQYICIADCINLTFTFVFSSNFFCTSLKKKTCKFIKAKQNNYV